MMKKLIICISFLVGCFGVNSQNITAVEYFMDADTGLGNGTALTGFTNQANVLLTGIQVPTNTNTGFHVFGFRSKDANNKWSHTEFTTCYVFAVTTPQPITAIEYFIDLDPGEGNASTIPGVVSQPNVSISNIAIPVNTAPGIHVVGFRSKDTNNKWSHTNFSTFYVAENAVLPNITQLEYFWQSDTGFGNNTIVEVNDGTNILANFPFDVNVPGSLLTGSAYTLFVRAKDANGTFSHTNYVAGITISTLGINEQEKIGIQMYPNPVVDYLQVATTDGVPFRLMIYDMAGKQLSDAKITTSQAVDLSHLSAGTYLAYVWKNANQIQTFKIVKQ